VARDAGAVDAVEMYYRNPDDKLLYVTGKEFTSIEGAKHSGLNTSVANLQSKGYQVLEEYPVGTMEGEQLGQAVRLHKIDESEIIAWTNNTLSIVTICKTVDPIVQFYQEADY
jgi:hypothetical protein